MSARAGRLDHGLMPVCLWLKLSYYYSQLNFWLQTDQCMMTVRKNSLNSVRRAPPTPQCLSSRMRHNRNPALPAHLPRIPRQRQHPQFLHPSHQLIFHKVYILINLLDKIFRFFFRSVSNFTELLLHGYKPFWIVYCHKENNKQNTIKIFYFSNRLHVLAHM